MAYGGLRAWRAGEQRPVPATKVRRGDVAITVAAKGSLQGGNSRMLLAPMTGSREMVLTQLRRPGEQVEKGDVVAAFDTTEETFKLREAEADLAEAGQQVLQANAEAAAREQELETELITAKGELEQAELECRRNPLLAAIVVQQNELMLRDARDKLAKLEREYPERKAAARASVTIQEAARTKAEVLAATARKNIDMMTLRAPDSGYVHVESNTNSNFFFTGMTFPMFQVGDQVRAGMAVAQIPDMDNWEAKAQIAETDRGHLAIGQKAELDVVALGGRRLEASVADLGGTTGPPWNRRFECKLRLHAKAAELRPGMSVRIVVNATTLQNVLWVPAQAVFENDGRTFVYVAEGDSFVARDVKVLRRSESRVVLEGIAEGATVALARPGQKPSTGSDQRSKSNPAAGVKL